MINNSLLGDRLNAFKNNIKPSTEINKISNLNTMMESIGFVSGIILSILKVFIYGFSLKLIFTTDWNFIETSIIGLSFVLILSYFKSLFINFKIYASKNNSS